MTGMLSRKHEVVTAEVFERWKETYRPSVGDERKVLRHKLACGLCGTDPQVGDTRRFVYANFEGGAPGGNFFVCPGCDDGTDAAANAKRRELHAQFLELHKRFSYCKFCPRDD